MPDCSKPIDGDILIGDRRVNDLAPDQRDLAMVFQNYALYPHMTVFENLAFPLRARGRRARRRPRSRRRSMRWPRRSGVSDLLARYPKELSGGQQQRVALGRAMVRDPKVFLLDEPLSNLDARLRIRMRKDIKALHAALQSTIVYVTHDQSEAMTMSSRIAVFDRGHLQQYATPRSDLQPAGQFLRRQLRGRARDQSARRHAVGSTGDGAMFNGQGLAIPPPRHADSGGLRRRAPRSCSACAPKASCRSPVTGRPCRPRVVLTELAGPDQVVYATAGDGVEICCRAEPTAHLARGQSISLSFIPERLHFFDPVTTRSLA